VTDLEPGALGRAIFGEDDAARRALLLAAVQDRRVFAALVPVLQAGVASASTTERARAVHAARALAVRAVVEPLLAAWEAEPERFLDVPDPLASPPGTPLALAAYACVRDLHVRGDLQAGNFLRAGLAIPVLRVEAFYAIGAEAGGALVPHLAALLGARPDLAGPAATLFALRFREDALAACEALSTAPVAVRRAFGTALLRHLARVKAVRLMVACRASLFSREHGSAP
jgi:hypothetical protein